MIHAIKIIVSLMVLSFSVHATDEYWGIYQFRSKLNESNFLFTEYVRRDSEFFFNTKNLDLLRVSVGGKWGEWTYLLGAAYVDFTTNSDERRIHQFLIRTDTLTDNGPKSISSVIRLGLEERSFINDENLYLRGRARVQLNFPIINQFGFAVYDEILLALNGEKKFYQGINENRLGFGLRFKTSEFEAILYQTFGKIKTLKSETNPLWIQLQTIYNF